MKQHFGTNSLLFCLYEFLHDMRQKPERWEEVFEFLGYRKSKAIIQKMALDDVKGKK